jgi:hypothetical protein
MPFRDMIREILQEETANGGGALTSADPTLIDPRLLTYNTELSRSASTSTSSGLSGLLLRPKTTYNKSKKRTKIKSVDNDKDEALARKKPDTKINLGVAILGLTEQIDLVRKSKEKFLTNQQKAV